MEACGENAYTEKVCALHVSKWCPFLASKSTNRENMQFLIGDTLEVSLSKLPTTKIMLRFIFQMPF